MRVLAAGPDDWQIEFATGAATITRGGFASRDTAAAWGREVEQAAAASTFRIGRKRVVATGAEAVGRWAIQQGILPRAEGGTQLAPAVRLAGLLADPACALPLAALLPSELAALRARRLAALGSVAMLRAEQAALAAAIAALLDLHRLPVAHPFIRPAPDGWRLLDAAECEAVLACARRQGAAQALALDLLFATAAAPEELAACRAEDLDPATGSLALPGRRVALPPALAQGLAAGLPGEGALAGLAALAAGRAADLQLTALVLRLQGGAHFDEACLLAGGEAPGPDLPLVPWLE